MSNSQIFTIGETIFDILIKNGQPVAGRPGGAMLNSAVSLGRLRLPVSLISEVGLDHAGNEVCKFLGENGIGCKYLYRYSNGKTAISLAFLDENEEAQYDFYKIYPDKRLAIKFPAPGKNDFLLFGSFFAIAPEIRSKVSAFVNAACQKGSLIVYDPNIRNPHAHELDKLMLYIDENISMADIVRGSMDDFKLIFQLTDPEKIYERISALGCKNLICTDASQPVRLMTDKFNIEVPVPETHLLSTVGAGDSFNAGLLYGLFKMNLARQDLSSLKLHEWETLLEIGITFGTTVCESYDNYISREFAAKLHN
ncbi:MAG: carbohydrate kinase [Bacteroidales bacterium]|nr:carbohydrate kinase [Bacteroidales bacterium]